MPKKKSKPGVKKSVVNAKYLRTYSNLVPDKLDPRDRSLMAASPRLAQSLPASVDYSQETGPPQDQGNTGSCVGWSVAYGLRRWLHFKEHGRRKKFSVRFVWTASKEIDQWVPNALFELSGTSIRDSFKVLRKYGICSDTIWPFDSILPKTQDEEKLLNDALKNRIGNYHALETNIERKAHLAKKGPFVCGVPVYANWDGIGADGLVPSPGGDFNGGHAVLVVGYDDNTNMFKFQNSWSKEWGDSGYGYFTYDYMEQHSWNSWGADQLS
ncbi:MAG: C1 family peptidase [Pseudomonadota bacterium]